jgi:hypothetical protein
LGFDNRAIIVESANQQVIIIPSVTLLQTHISSVLSEPYKQTTTTKNSVIHENNIKPFAQKLGSNKYLAKLLTIIGSLRRKSFMDYAFPEKKKVSIQAPVASKFLSPKCLLVHPLEKKNAVNSGHLVPCRAR